MRPVLGDAEAGPLRAVTSAAVGLWLMSVVIMLAGSLIPGALTLWVWWPVIAIGVVLAALLFWLEQRRELSADTLTGSQGGDFGPLTRDQYQVELASEIFSMSEGELAGPVQRMNQFRTR